MNLDPARTVTYGHTNGGLTSVANYASSITYHPNGMMNQLTRVNGVRDTWSLNTTNRMARPAAISVVKTSTATTHWNSGTFAYDPSGNIHGIGTNTYRYDLASRLLEGRVVEAGTGWKQSYTYDGFGNMLSNTTTNASVVTKTIGTQATTNRLTAATYDSAGNVVTLSDIDSYTFGYDALGVTQSLRPATKDWPYTGPEDS